MHPEFEILSDEDDGLHTGRIVPIYTAIGKVSTRIFRTLLDRIPSAKASIRFRTRCRKESYINSETAGFMDHDSSPSYFPSPDSELRLLNAFRSPAQFRLIFEEFFWLECGLELKRARARLDPGIGFQLSEKVRSKILEMLPFKPTGASETRTARKSRKIWLRLVRCTVCCKARRRQRQNAGSGGGGHYRH